MGNVNLREIEFLVELLNKYPIESLRKIAESEGIDYYRLKRIYDKYYGKYIQVNAMYNISRIGLKSFVAFLSVPRSELREVAWRMFQNPYVVYLNAMFGFKNGISAILHIPRDQVDRVDDLLGRYSDDYEYYSVLSYPPSKDKKETGEWNLSHDYAVLMDILKWDARTPMKEISRQLGKSRPTIKYMMNRLREEGILTGFTANVDTPAYDRGVLGITDEIKGNLLERFKDHEIMIGTLKPKGYIIEWFFSSKEDLGTKLFEFSSYVEKVGIEYFDILEDLERSRKYYRFSKMVKKDGSRYRSILEF